MHRRQWQLGVVIAVMRQRSELTTREPNKATSRASRYRTAETIARFVQLDPFSRSHQIYCIRSIFESNDAAQFVRYRSIMQGNTF